MGIEVGGLLGLIILVLDVFAIVKIIGSGASTGSKVLWVVVILVLPLIGLILWWLMGPKAPGHASTQTL
jgi:Phospholipase_D-nuclease N-terminal